MVCVSPPPVPLLLKPPVPSLADYTHRSGPLRVRALTQGGGGSLSSTPLLTPSEAEEYVSSRHFAIVQVWRPIHLPVQDCPLAVCGECSNGLLRMART